MSNTAIEYVERTTTGGWRIAGSRVSLDSIVGLYWEGYSPEAIVEEFASLSSEQVYGAIAYYLRHRADIDAYLAAQDASWAGLQQRSSRQHGALLNRIKASRPSNRNADSP